MRKFLSQEQIKDASFSDAPITNFVLNSKKRELQFKSDTYVGCHPDGRWFDDCQITIKDFDSISIVEDDTQVVSEYTDVYAIREICEFEYSDELIVMRGFTVGRGLWTEFRISGGNISAVYDEANQNSE